MKLIYVFVVLIAGIFSVWQLTRAFQTYALFYNASLMQLRHDHAISKNTSMYRYSFHSPSVFVSLFTTINPYFFPIERFKAGHLKLALSRGEQNRLPHEIAGRELDMKAISAVYGAGGRTGGRGAERLTTLSNEEQGKSVSSGQSPALRESTDGDSSTNASEEHILKGPLVRTALASRKRSTGMSPMEETGNFLEDSSTISRHRTRIAIGTLLEEADKLKDHLVAERGPGNSNTAPTEPPLQIARGLDTPLPVTVQQSSEEQGTGRRLAEGSGPDKGSAPDKGAASDNASGPEKGSKPSKESSGAPPSVEARKEAPTAATLDVAELLSKAAVLGNSSITETLRESARAGPTHLPEAGARPRWIGSDWRSPFAKGADHQWSVVGVPECAGQVVPEDALLPPAVNSSFPVDSLDALRTPGLRTLVFVPRMGLGNTLRAYYSSFVFSLLTGRRLVLFHAGPHRQVLSHLLSAFDCGKDVIESNYWKGAKSDYRNFMWDYRRNELVPKGRGANLIERFYARDIATMFVMSGSPFDEYWYNNLTRRACVLETLQCHTMRCVHSKAINHLLRNQPKEELRSVIEEVIHGVAPDGTRLDVPEGAGLHMKFDVALHMRTLTRTIEKVPGIGQPCDRSNLACLQTSAMLRDTFLLTDFWGCLSHPFLAISGSLPPPSSGQPPVPLNIFLATDREALRPDFVRLLQRYGNVFSSSGPVVHTSKGDVGHHSGLPTMAEFYLLSRSNQVFVFKKRMSTFSQAAALYGFAAYETWNPKKGRPCTFRII
eukprot:TRINITY_DN5914_c0_g1_i1.p1 TRINITY_DN5914_c0_g1~~TRINITY_DN5914_c0_g1_i1.p1  ORF type:complete len:775 (-),score=71.30 TRINITY_DN5914_c0_g1_i1:174-2498(-)